MSKYDKNHHGAANGQKIVLSMLCVLLALVLFVLIFMTAYIHHLLNRMNRIDPSTESSLSFSEALDMMYTNPDLVTMDPNSTETYIDINDVTFPTESTESVYPTDHGEHIINILLVGQDRREHENYRTRSDTMILVTFNTNKNSITLTSFMRDSYVQIPGYAPNKLNAAYAYGGMNLLNKTLLVNFGVVVDGVVEVDFSRFEKVINLLGGVEITLTQKEADYLNEEHGYHLRAGTQILDGEKTLNYSRIRYIDSDYQRTARHRNVITSLVKRFKNKSLAEGIVILEDVLPLVTTNMSNSDIISLAISLFPMLSTAQINNQRIPVDGTFDAGYAQVRDGLYDWFQYNIDFESNRDILNRIFSAN